jgi:hypothetical protein
MRHGLGDGKARRLTICLAREDRVTMGDRLTVYYDGGCPICSREIGFFSGNLVYWLRPDEIEQLAADEYPGVVVHKAPSSIS